MKRTLMTVEAYGHKGMKGLAWRKAFASFEALKTWAIVHDAEIIGTREITKEEAQANYR